MFEQRLEQDSESRWEIPSLWLILLVYGVALAAYFVPTLGGPDCQQLPRLRPHARAARAASIKCPRTT